MKNIQLLILSDQSSCKQGFLIDTFLFLVSPQVKISFHTTLEILTYQHLPEDQLLPGLQVLQLESGDKILEFKQDLIIEYSNNTRQVCKTQSTRSTLAFEVETPHSQRNWTTAV